MTTRLDEQDADRALEAALRDWLPTEAPGAAPADLRRRVIDLSAAMRQHKRTLPLDLAPGRWRIGASGFAAAGLGLAVVVGGLALLGGGTVGPVGSSPSPSVTGPAPSPTASEAIGSSPWSQGAPPPGNLGWEDGELEYIGWDGGSLLALQYANPPGSTPQAIRLIAYDVGANRWTDRGLIDDRGRAATGLAAPSSTVAANGVIYMLGYGDVAGQGVPVAWPIDGTTLQGPLSEPARYPLNGGTVLGAEGRIYTLDTPGNGTPEQGPQILRIYDPATDVWTVAPPMPTPRTEALLVANADGSIWVIGGRALPVWASNEPTGGESIRSVVRFDPASGRWSDRTDSPFDLDAFAAATFADDGSLIVVDLHPPDIHVHRLDPDSNAWSVEEAPPDPVTPAAIYPTGDGRLVLFGAKVPSGGSSWSLGGPQLTWILDLSQR